MAPLTRILTVVGAPAFAVALLFFYIPFETPAQGLSPVSVSSEPSPTPEEIRTRAIEVEGVAKALRKDTTYTFAGALMAPYFLNTIVLSKTTTKEIAKAARMNMRNLRKYAPTEMEAAVRAAMVVVEAVHRYADALDTLAKKLRQQADRLERQQKKKN